MKTALLKFQPPSQAMQQVPLDPAILAGAVEASPEPLAVVESGKVIYANRSFAQLSALLAVDKANGGPAEAIPTTTWCTTGFAVGGRAFSLTTLSPETPAHSGSDAAHLEMVGRLVGGVAHDFNNLLTGVLLYCDLLKTQLAPANPLSPKIDEIRHAAEQGAGLIRQLMTVGREEKDAPRWVSFNHAVREIVPLLQRLLGEHIAITLDLAETAPRVGLSLAEAQQLILNLVLNARDAMPTGGLIRLETTLRGFEGTGLKGRTFEFTVSDSGTGMDAETAANIFEPFYTTKVKGRGNGIGLATVKRIVEAAGGIVAVDTNPGRGTRMTIRLPQIEVSDIESTETEATKAEATKIEPKKVQAGVEALRLAKSPSRRRPQQSANQQSDAPKSENRGAGV